MIHLTFPDNSVRDFESGVTGREIAEGISKSLAKKAVAMALDGTLADLSDRIAKDARIEIVTRDDPRALELIRHDAAHVMAEAVQELYPGTQVTIGPVIENGFYYDFFRNQPFTTDDLPAIEAKMRQIIQRNAPFTKEVWSRDKARSVFEQKGEAFKVELVDAIPEDQDLKIYKQGDWFDLCRGPAYGLDRTDRRRLQADEGGRRLLARRFQQSNADPHLRDGLAQQGRTRRLRHHAGRGGEARPPPPRPGAGSVPFPGGRAGCRVLARQRLDVVPDADRLHAAAARRHLSGGQRTAGARQGVLGDLRSLDDFPREHVRGAAGRGGDRGRRSRLCVEADELSRSHPDLQARAEIVPRPADAARRVRRGPSLRAVGRHARPFARARIYPGRCPRLLHRGADRGGMPAHQRPDPLGLCRLRLRGVRW